MDKSTRFSLGLALAIIGAVLCIAGTFGIFLRWYGPVINAELAAGRPDEATIVQFIFPALSDIGVLAGVLWILAALGFGMRKPWAWSLGVAANVMALQSSFFPMIPPVTRGLPPASALVFVPSLVSFVLMLTLVRRVDWRVLVIALFSGIALVLSFMNGVAATDKMIVTDASLFVAVQRLNWIAALGWGVFTVGLITRPVAWVRWVGLGAATLEVVAGLPLGIVTAVEAGRFSMFLPAPLLSAALLVVLLLPLGAQLATRGAPVLTSQAAAA